MQTIRNWLFYRPASLAMCVAAGIGILGLIVAQFFPCVTGTFC